MKKSALAEERLPLVGIVNMSDVFQQALTTALPLLQEIKGGIKQAPKASRAALNQLRAAVAAGPRNSHSLPSEPAASTPPKPFSPKVWTWDELEKAVRSCQKCQHLVTSRTQVVFGVGNRAADLMFVGEAPGEDEDLQGEPFVGKAGQLITKIIQAMGFERSDVFIANILKCRPDMPAGDSGNRKPKLEEMHTCLPWLEEQIQLVNPKVIVALGATAAEGLLGETRPLRDLRGNWLMFREIPVMITYHPAYLLRNQTITEKRKVWEDMLKVLTKLGHDITPKQQKFFTQSAE